MTNNKALILFIFTFFILEAPFARSKFPAHWWARPELHQKVPDWEILPDQGISGKTLILSKRNELGILSNFAATPIIYEGTKYASLEGAWQSMKYPESKKDLRYGNDSLPFTRKEVEKMVGFEAKRAGSLASRLMKKHDVNYVTYKGKKLTYRTESKGEHYRLIKSLMEEKLRQNEGVKKILKSTGKLILLPDHHSSSKVIPPAWKYYQIWMDLREKI